MPPGALQEVTGASWTMEGLPGGLWRNGKNQAAKRARLASARRAAVHDGSAVDPRMRGTIGELGEPSEVAKAIPVHDLDSR